MTPVNRIRPDRCPGALRPWPAHDGLLVRLRLPGGRVRPDQLRALSQVAQRYGDGQVHVTTRANLQLRAMPALPGSETLPPQVLDALVGTGLLPSPIHDLSRNMMASPQTGLAGGRIDLRSMVGRLDAELCGDPVLGRLPGRFLFVLDDGRGDLLNRSCDLGLVALDESSLQLRVGEGWGPTVSVVTAHRVLADLARRFLDLRGTGTEAPWHVTELVAPLIEPYPPAPDLPTAVPALPYGAVPGGFHHQVPASGLDAASVERLCETAPVVIVTPWRGVLIPEETP